MAVLSPHLGHSTKTNGSPFASARRMLASSFADSSLSRLQFGHFSLYKGRLLLEHGNSAAAPERGQSKPLYHGFRPRKTRFKRCSSALPRESTVSASSDASHTIMGDPAIRSNTTNVSS